MFFLCYVKKTQMPVNDLNFRYSSFTVDRFFVVVVVVFRPDTSSFHPPHHAKMSSLANGSVEITLLMLKMLFYSCQTVLLANTHSLS